MSELRRLLSCMCQNVRPKWMAPTSLYLFVKHVQVLLSALIVRFTKFPFSACQLSLIFSLRLLSPPTFASARFSQVYHVPSTLHQARSSLSNLFHSLSSQSASSFSFTR
ncbi:hypothetical protein ILYODFUR_037795 [Ilyodon furcidens]|uniref:Uncharacterized protein n=1 Tax=Ilyodon furcidens TaxID=33524 RepID=A0ABV0SU60_9TELE